MFFHRLPLNMACLLLGVTFAGCRASETIPSEAAERLEPSVVKRLGLSEDGTVAKPERDVTEADLETLQEIPQLRELHLWYSYSITDAGMANLAKLTTLRKLHLINCYGITDAGLTHLRGLEHLEEIRIYGCEKITDAGLAHLVGLKKLESLCLIGCDLITDAAVVELQKALPELKKINR